MQRSALRSELSLLRTQLQDTQSQKDRLHDQLVAADIQRREERCRQRGGIGTVVVILQCGDISQVMPVEVDAPNRISWDARDDWAEVLQRFVDSGRTDFKPISSTRSG